MATFADRLSDNAAGKYYVDSSCIDCDACRAKAPDFFGRSAEGYSFVTKQPATAEDVALIEEIRGECATSSIGDDGA